MAEALAERGHAVELLDLQLAPAEPAALHKTRLRLRHWREVDPGEIRERFDLVVLEIGDHYLFHAGIFPLLGQHDCVGIFHDFYLYDLFAGWAHFGGHTPEVQEAEVVQTYGAAARNAAQAARRGELSLAEIASTLPMTEWIARRCRAAVAHSEFYRPRLDAACPGFVTTASLAWPGRAIAPLPLRKRDRLTLLTVGVMNPNKCADRVIEAICSSEHLLKTLTYRLVGPIDPAEQARLERLARDGGFAGLRIDGAASDAELEAALDDADMIACLRQPVLEGASASAIEAMLSGRPVLVANAGFYGDLPNNVVFKVGADVAPEAIAAPLERLVEDENLRRSTGRAAAEWAAQTFTVDNYLARLEPILQETEKHLPVLRVGGVLADELTRLGLTRDDPVVRRISAALSPALVG